ncbi:nickel ABC transporter substrate-binding protein [Crassaminicella profunda]|uniref:nickel ABC transporter substrate-binding protein n=1 Tax=Crassaminicella profunda TaxID=1286698 RepID=UPI001CA6CCE9|nr:nickel ABC transporter substrate-binding protein [Crassaminicella profunda]QZY53862.1 nickel ABC transporter substrate-binding protein [Crassaminicella profunda]
MKKKSKLLGLMLAMIILLAGCGKVEKVDVESKETKQNHEISIGWSSDLDNFGPLTSEDGYSHEILGLVYEPLVKFDGERAVPYLAEKFETSDDGKVYTFHLRKDVKFSDGIPLNALAVKQNMDGILQNVDRFSWMGGIGKLEKVKVVDEYTVQFIYKEPYYAALLDMCAQFPIRMISPGAIPEDGNTAGILKESIGTGPYILSEAVKDQEYIFTLNEDYWGEKPKYKKVIIKVIPDPDARMMALESGDIDLIYGAKQLSYEAYSQFENNNKIGRVLSENESETRSILLNTKNEILSDINVRKAILSGVNKENIIDTTLLGLEEKADTILNPKLPYCNVSVDSYKYNTEKAIELLEKAGWLLPEGKEIREKMGKKLSLELMYVTGRGAEGDIAKIFAAQMKEIGIEIKLDGVELMIWGSRGFEGDFELSFNATYAAPYDPHTYIGGMISYSLDNAAQQGLSEKLELDKKIAKLFSINDKVKIQSCYNEILKQLNDSAIYIPISYQKQIALYNKEKISSLAFPPIAGELDMRLIK